MGFIKHFNHYNWSEDSKSLSYALKPLRYRNVRENNSTLMFATISYSVNQLTVIYVSRFSVGSSKL